MVGPGDQHHTDWFGDRRTVGGWPRALPGCLRSRFARPPAPVVAAEMEKHVQTFLGEFRTVIPALGALLGFQLMAAFQPTYHEIAPVDRALNFAGVCCSTAAFIFLVTPAAYHRFIGVREGTRDFLRFARGCIMLTFVFLPVSLALALYLQAVRTFESSVAGYVVGGVALVAFVVAWWLVPRWRAKVHAKESIGGE